MSDALIRRGDNFSRFSFFHFSVLPFSFGLFSFSFFSSVLQFPLSVFFLFPLFSVSPFFHFLLAFFRFHFFHPSFNFPSQSFFLFPLFSISPSFHFLLAFFRFPFSSVFFDILFLVRKTLLPKFVRIMLPEMLTEYCVSSIADRFKVKSRLQYENVGKCKISTSLPGISVHRLLCGYYRKKYPEEG